MCQSPHIDDWIPRGLKLARPRGSGEWNTRKGWGTAATQTVDWFWISEKLHTTGYGAARTPGGIASDHT